RELPQRRLPPRGPEGAPRRARRARDAPSHRRLLRPARRRLAGPRSARRRRHGIPGRGRWARCALPRAGRLGAPRVRGTRLGARSVPGLDPLPCAALRSAHGGRVTAVLVGNALAKVNALLNLTSFSLLLAGLAYIKQRRLAAHERCMKAAFVSSALFL